MIPIEHYSTIYHLTIALLTIGMFLPILDTNGLTVKSAGQYNWFSGIILIIVVAFIGLRNPNADFRYLGDTIAYTRMYNNMELPVISTSKDYGFEFFMYLGAKVMNVQVFYLLCAALYVLLPYLAFRKWFGNRAWIALLAYVTAMSFWSFGINGLRNGLAASFFVYGLSFLRQPIKLIALFALAISFHKSMFLPVGSFMATRYIKNTNVLFLIWFLSIPFAYFFGNGLEYNVNYFFDSIGFKDNRIASFFLDEIDGQSIERRFRLDFILYSSVPIILGLIFVNKFRYKDDFFIRLLNTYILTNTVWLYLIYAAYTNRIAYLSWFLMPIILVYPLLRKRFLIGQIDWLFFIVIGSLSFTLIMHFK